MPEPLKTTIFGRDTELAILREILAVCATFELLVLPADRLQRNHVLMTGTFLSEDLPRGHALRQIQNELRWRSDGIVAAFS